MNTDDSSFSYLVYCLDSRLQIFYKFSVFKNFTKFIRKYLCWNLFLKNCRLDGCNFIKTETLTQVFSCEFYKIFRAAFLQNASSDCLFLNNRFLLQSIKKESDEIFQVKGSYINIKN